jgi:hypothetical protein
MSRTVEVSECDVASGDGGTAYEIRVNGAYLNKAEIEALLAETNKSRTLSSIMELIDEMREHGAVHVRKGFKLTDVHPHEKINHAVEELRELQDSPNDIDELADALAPLLDYAIEHFWSEADLCAAIRKKLLMRFKWSNNPNPEGRQPSIPEPLI